MRRESQQWLVLWMLALVPAIANAADWRLSKLRYGYSPVPELTFESTRPITSFGDGALGGELRSEPALNWECLLHSERELRCAVDEPPELALATPLTLRLAAGAFTDQQGAQLDGLALTVSTPRPSLRVEIDPSETDPRVFRLIAPMTLQQDSIERSLRATIDGASVGYALTETGPSRRLDFNSQLWPALAPLSAEAGQPIWWDAPISHAWRLRLERLPKAGQRLEMRLAAGLKSRQGPLSNAPLSADGDSLLRFTVPPNLSVQVSCVDPTMPQSRRPAAVSVLDCPPEMALLLLFSSPPNAHTLAQLAASLPPPLRIDPQKAAAPPPLRSLPRSHNLFLELATEGYELPILGATAAQDYRIDVQTSWSGHYGQSVESGDARQLHWRTSVWTARAAITPQSSTLRRRQQNLPILTLRGQQSVSGRSTWTYPNGRREERAFRLEVDPLAAEPASARLEIPTDRPLWAIAETDLPEGLIPVTDPMDPLAWDPRWLLWSGARVAVTDFGLHTFRVGAQLVAIVSDLDRGTPLARVRVRVHRGEKVIGRGRSDVDGIVVFAVPADIPSAELLVVAEQGQNAAVLGLNRFDFVGDWRQPKFASNRAWAGGRFALFTDKPLYKHGETVRYRLFSNSALAGQNFGGPSRKPSDRVKISLLSDGSVLESSVVSLDRFGGHSGSLQLPSEGPDWGYELLVDQQALPISVVEHAAPRIESELLLPTGSLVSGDSVPARVQLRRLSGEPLVGQQMQLHGRFREGGDPLAEDFPGFRFSDENWSWLFDEHAQPCSSDEDGRTSLAFPPTDRLGSSTQRWPIPELNCEFATGEVAILPSIELPGSALGPPQTVRFSRQPRYLGLAGLPSPGHFPGQELNLRAIAVDARSLSAMPAVKAEIAIERSAGEAAALGSAAPQRVERVQHCALAADGIDACLWLTAPGRYRVRLSAPGFDDNSFSLEVAEARGWSAPRRARAELLLEQDRWPTGESIEMHLSHAFEGASALLLVSDDQGLRARRWYRLEQRQQRLLWTPEADLRGAFRVSVLIIPAPGAGALQKVEAVQSAFHIDAPAPKLFDLEAPTLSTAGEEIVVKVRSTHAEPLALVLTAYDDALSVLSSEAMDSRRIDRWSRERGSPWPELPTLNSVLQSDDGRMQLIATGAMVTSPFDDRRFNPADSDLDRRSESAWSIASKAELPAGLRRHFASSFWWRSDELLAPGETREFRLRLPDDLTRWRIEGVARDLAGEVEQRSVTVDARKSLALQPRAPRHLYPGDKALLSAGLYSSASEPFEVQWSIHAPGLDRHTSRTLRPEQNAFASLRMAVAPEVAGEQLWWTQAEAVDEWRSPASDRPSGDGVLAALEVREAFAPATVRQIGLVPADGVLLQPSRFIGEAGQGQLGVRLGLDPLFGLGGVVAESQKRGAWLPDIAVDQLLIAVLAAQLGEPAELPAKLAALQSSLRDHLLGEGWIHFRAAGSEEPDRALSRRVWLGLAELHALGVDVALPPAAKQDWAWQAGDSWRERLPGSTLWARRMSARLLNGEPATTELTALLAEPTPSTEASARLSMALAKSGTFSQQRAAANQRLRAHLLDESVHRPLSIVGDLSATGLRCLTLQALVVSDEAADASAVQRRAMSQFFSAWGGDLPAQDLATIRHCLQAAQAFSQRWLDDSPAKVQLRFGDQLQRATLQPRGEGIERSQSWATDQPLQLRINAADSALVSYEIAFQRPIDLRSAAAEGQAIQISRSYRLFRDGQWLPESSPAQEGDWMQVELQVRAAKPIAFAAITEAVPGGLVPIDPWLDSGVDPILYSELEDHWQSRQLGSAENRFASLYLSPGLNKLHYLARVSYAGDYAWPGPQIELLYAPQVRARGAAQRLQVGALENTDEGMEATH